MLYINSCYIVKKIMKKPLHVQHRYNFFFQNIFSLWLTESVDVAFMDTVFEIRLRSEYLGFVFCWLIT